MKVSRAKLTEKSGLFAVCPFCTCELYLGEFKVEVATDLLYECPDCRGELMVEE